MDRKNIIEHLGKLIKQGKELDASEAFDNNFQKWKNDVFIVLNNIYPLSNKLIRRINSINFGYESDPTDPFKRINRFDISLAEATNLLVKFKNMIGSPKYYPALLIAIISNKIYVLRWKLPTNYLMKLVGTVIAGVMVWVCIQLLTPVIIKEVPKTEMKSIDISYRLTEISYRNWRTRFESEVKKSYDSLRNQLAQRVGLKSGLAYTKMVEFYEEKEMIMNNTTDSFFISYSIQGGDTLSLNYNRQLPISPPKQPSMR